VNLEANLKTLANASDTSSDSILIEIKDGTHDIADEVRCPRLRRLTAQALEYDEAFAIRWALRQSTNDRRDFEFAAATAAQNANLTIGEPVSSVRITLPASAGTLGRSLLLLTLLSLLPLSIFT